MLRFLTRSPRPTHSTHPTRPNRHLVLERLEDRLTPSLTAIFPLELATNRDIYYDNVATSTSSSSNHSIIAWEAHRERTTEAPSFVHAAVVDEHNNGISDGYIVVGHSLDVSDTDPDVAMNSSDDFVMVWLRHAGTQSRVLAARFDGTGHLQGNLFPVRPSGNNQIEPNVAIMENGNFVISYTEILASSPSTGITNSVVHAVQFQADGDFVRDIVVSPTTGINQQSSLAVRPSLDNPMGSFYVAYASGAAFANARINVVQFNRFGDPLGSFPVTTSGPSTILPRITVNVGGDGLIAYRVLNRNPDGTFLVTVSAVRFHNRELGEEIALGATGSESIGSRPSVAIRQDIGGLRAVVTFDQSVVGVPGFMAYEIHGDDSVTPLTSILRDPFVLDYYVTIGGYAPAVSMDSHGNYTIAFAWFFPDNRAEVRRIVGFMAR